MATKISLGKGEIYDRILAVRKNFGAILVQYAPDLVCVEQTVMIQNPETTRKLSYIVGVVMAETLNSGIDMIDVPPMTWKSAIGAKPINKKWKESIVAEFGEKAGKAEINRLKKSQVQDKLSIIYPSWSKIWEDNDIADSCGIAWWAAHAEKL